MDVRMTVHGYLSADETNRPQELTFGVLREPPAPSFHHQVVVGGLHVQLDAYVRRHQAGRIVASPVDVVLDRDRGLIVQPDLVFVAAARLDICTDRIWGPPDLVVEVLSTANRRHDRIDKVQWYQSYGVHECWIVDPVARTCEVLSFAALSARLYQPGDDVQSHVLPHLRLAVDDIFAA